MIDSFHLPPRFSNDVQVFRPFSTNTNSAWQQWVKPPGISMIYMYAIGGGGGGGGGFTRASGAAGGGGGGGTGATASLLIPAFFVPDTLYVQPGIGGLGSTGSTVAGSAGGHSYVSIGAFPAGTVASMITAQQVYLHSGLLATPAGGGGAGTVAVGGPAGVAGAIATAPLNTLGSNMGFWKATVGKVGFIGGFSAAGTASSNVLSASTTTTAGGAGGAGANAADTAGGAVTGAGIFLTIPGGTAGSNNGSAGSSLFGMSVGGSGGGASAAGIGGHGGDAGGVGSGGGGGGSGTTGGRGGRGGDGMVVIISW